MADAGQVTVRGLTIGYKRAGQGPPLMLLHGIGGNTAQFRRQLDGFSDEFTAIAWDAPGYGRSDDPPGGWTMADYSDHLAGFFDALGIERAHLLGQSWGGVLAQQFYGRYPDRVRSLILSDTTLGGDATRPDGEQRLQSRLQAAETMKPTEYARARAPRLLSAAPSPALLHEVEAMLAEMHPAGFRSAAIALAHADTRDVLPRIAVPTLVLCGERDQVTAPAVGTWLIAEIPQARLVIFPGSGHLSNQEFPEQYNATVREFLQSVP